MSKQPLQTFLAAIDAAIATKDAGGKNERAGIIASNKDGIIEIEGLSGLKMGEVVQVEGTSIEALVMEVRRNAASGVLLQPTTEVKEGMAVLSQNKFLGISADESMIGRVIDPLGNAVDGGKALGKGTFMPLEAPAPSVMERQPVSEPVQTGILGIDALIPVGRGQRELIIGDRQTGKTTIGIDTIINQKDQDMICIYVAIGQREVRTKQALNTLMEHGAMEYTIIVSAPAASSAVMQYMAPYAGVAIAEYFMKKGKHVLVIYNDLSKHAVAYREMSLLLRKPPGREAFPGDVFYIHSRLLERAAKLNDALGGGSITALPMIETQAGDVSAYIPTNVISITDGQIFLDSDLFNRGIRPAVNVGISVSRVGGAAQTKIMKKVSGSAKLNLAQYYELAAFSQFASELDEGTRKQLVRGERMVEALKQRAHQPFALWQEVFILYAASNGHLDQFPLKEAKKALWAWLEAAESKHVDLINMINKEKALTDDIEAGLKKAVEELSQYGAH